MAWIKRSLGCIALTTIAIGAASLPACGSSGGGFSPDDDAGAPKPSEDGGDTFDADPGPGLPGFGDASVTPVGSDVDPTTCAEAVQAKSYVGCDYWPTVVANNVWSIFDFAVVVANVGTSDADVTVTGPSGTNQTVKVPPGELQKIFLPWVADLKGGDADECGSSAPLAASVVSKGGAYHLVSSSPVIVYQFNALEYKGSGGAPGKNWATCPGTAKECTSNPLLPPQKIGCFSFSNDASLLLPSTAMTGTYRVAGQHGASAAPLIGPKQPIMGSYFAVTATQAATKVTVKLSAAAKVLAGGSITAGAGGSTLTFTLDAGDVAEVVGDKGEAIDLSGSLVQADKPVQVISGVPCIEQPADKPACDHIEETVFPAETLGKHYIVTVPTGPKGNVVGHIVRMFGNVDGTTLTYSPSKPAGCPATLNAGQVVDCGQVADDFDVTGDHEFAVGSFMLGGTLLDPGTLAGGGGLGDPSESFSVAVEQYRKNYLFLAPDDYDVSYVDVIAATGTNAMLDGVKIAAPPKAIGTTGFAVHRVKLGAGKGGAHTLTADKAVGIQVVGYGQYTSYQYPGGLNLGRIAPPPVK